ncbi:MAG: hypothetical protein RL657_663 [Pseudomonadota bacterium]|jgi:hypothetical protein
MPKMNQVERISYAGGLYGLLAGSSRGKLQAKVEEMNARGWNLHLIHPDSINLLIWIFRLFLLFITLGIWTIGSSELLVFEKDKE